MFSVSVQFYAVPPEILLKVHEVAEQQALGLSELDVAVHP